MRTAGLMLLFLAAAAHAGPLTGSQSGVQLGPLAPGDVAGAGQPKAGRHPVL